MKKELFGITFASFEHSYWAPAFVIVVVCVYRLWKKRALLVKNLTAPLWSSTLIKHFSARKQIIKSCLLVVALCGFFIAVLQPQWGEREQVLEQEGRELFVALDISRSMLAADIKPHRLAFAKAKIKRLLQLLPAERVGLIVFSGAAVMQCPLTRDTATFNLFLDQVDAETISSGTTSLDQALLKVITVMNDLPTKKNKIVVVFTDGEDFSSNLSVVKEQAKEIALHIFTYGVGTAQGAPVPIMNDNGQSVGYEKNEQGNVVMSKLNEGILQALSRESGGKYLSPTQSDDDLKSLVVDVEQFEKEKFDDKEISTQEDRYPYFLGISFFALLLEWLL